MADVRIELNSDGVRELLKSKEMQGILEEHARKTISGLGDGYEYSSYQGRNRVNTSVMVTTWDAYHDNEENNTILKALK